MKVVSCIRARIRPQGQTMSSLERSDRVRPAPAPVSADALTESRRLLPAISSHDGSAPISANSAPRLGHSIRIARVHHAAGQAIGNAEPGFDLAQHQHATIRGLPQTGDKPGSGGIASALAGMGSKSRPGFR
jgi:hypothetical protein